MQNEVMKLLNFIKKKNAKAMIFKTLNYKGNNSIFCEWAYIFYTRNSYLKISPTDGTIVKLVIIALAFSMLDKSLLVILTCNTQNKSNI